MLMRTVPRAQNKQKWMLFAPFVATLGSIVQRLLCFLRCFNNGSLRSLQLLNIIIRENKRRYHIKKNIPVYIYNNSSEYNELKLLIK